MSSFVFVAISINIKLLERKNESKYVTGLKNHSSFIIVIDNFYIQSFSLPGRNIRISLINYNFTILPFDNDGFLFHFLLFYLNIIKNYYSDWRLKLNSSKIKVSTFHLNNQLINKKLRIVFDGVELTNNPFLKYLGITLDRSLTFKEHLTKVSKKINSRINIIQKLAEVTWGENTSVLKTSSMSLIYTTAEYCASAWR